MQQGIKDLRQANPLCPALFSYAVFSLFILSSADVLSYKSLYYARFYIKIVGFAYDTFLT